MYTPVYTQNTGGEAKTNHYFLTSDRSVDVFDMFLFLKPFIHGLQQAHGLPTQDRCFCMVALPGGSVHRRWYLFVCPHIAKSNVHSSAPKWILKHHQVWFLMLFLKLFSGTFFLGLLFLINSGSSENLLLNVVAIHFILGASNINK